MPNTLLDLLLALGIGLLIGLERGWQRREAEEGTRIAGLRTFGLIGLLGGVWALLGKELGQLILGFGFLAMAALILLARWQKMRTQPDIGTTTAVAAMLTFTLGALAVLGFRLESASAAVLVTIILNLKPALHRGLKNISAEEMEAFFKLLLISVVMLPVLPNEGYGPWKVINPYELWWLVVLIAGISFAGYFAMKWAGVQRGVLLTAFFGGLASSTAATINLSRMVSTKTMLSIVSAGVLLTSATMFPRILVVVAAVNIDLVGPLALPFLVMTVIMFLGALFHIRHAKKVKLPDLPIQEPLSISMAVKFGLFLVAITVLAQAARIWMGETGVYLLSFFSGMADVDAISLSLARLEHGELAVEVALMGITIAAITNTLVKLALVFVIGGRTLGYAAIWIVLPTVAAGVVLTWLL